MYPYTMQPVALDLQKDDVIAVQKALFMRQSQHAFGIKSLKKRVDWACVGKTYFRLRDCIYPWLFTSAILACAGAMCFILIGAHGGVKMVCKRAIL